MTTSSEKDLSRRLQRFSSWVLWHITGYGKSDEDAYSILNTILTSRVLRISKSSESVYMPSGEKRVGYPVACACDIPFADLRIHIKRYGKCGIAFKREAAINHGGFNPVLYLHKQSPAFKKQESYVRELEALVLRENPAYEPLQNFMTLLGSYCKPTDLLSAAEDDPQKDQSQENNFYYEREWRTAWDWKFEDSSIAAIMIPTAMFSDFRGRWKDRFHSASLIASEMVETL